MMALENCRPKEVFKFFEQICRIPHGSGNEKALSDHVVTFAKERNLWVHQDDALNIIIKKPGTPGYENAPAVVIQGHLDMVCVKESEGYPHDFLKDPIQAYVDGDFVKARGTSLGADNATAIAMAMALLDSGGSVPHPPLEVVFTTDEEVGMYGASRLDAGLLDAKIFINLDSEEEGVFCSGCAGGVRAVYSLQMSMESSPEGYAASEIKISGLKGGHSGMMIHKERANANVLMGRLLYNLTERFDIYLAHINGGTADNVIAADAQAVILIREDDKEGALSLIGQMRDMFMNEFRYSDEGLEISVTSAAKPPGAFTRKLTQDIIAALRLVPNGVQSRSAVVKDLVESSNNIGVLRTDEKKIEMVFALRSLVESRKRAMLEQVHTVGKLTGALISTKGDYPEWEYSPDSKIRKLFMDTYNEMYPQREPAVEQAIHAGLECGWFAKKIGTTEMISLGPSHFDVHSVSERLSISSTERTYELLKAVLAKLK